MTQEFSSNGFKLVGWMTSDEGGFLPAHNKTEKQARAAGYSIPVYRKTFEKVDSSESPLRENSPASSRGADYKVHQAIDSRLAEVISSAMLDTLDANRTTLYLSIVKRTEKAVMDSDEIRKLRRLAAFGKVALRFVDRAGDHCKEDPAEKICDEFAAAMAAAFDDCLWPMK